MYKLYEYVVEAIMNDEVVYTTMKYIIDEQQVVVYYSLNNDMWYKAEGIELLHLDIDDKLVFKKNISEQELKNMLFLEGL